MRNYCPSHCRSVDAANHPKHTEPTQVFTSFLPSKHFRKIGEDCWHSSTNPKRRYRSWIKARVTASWSLNRPIAAVIENPNYKQLFQQDRFFSNCTMYWGTLEETFTSLDTIFVKYFIENSMYNLLHSVFQGDGQCASHWNRNHHKALTFTITNILKSRQSTDKCHCF